MELLLHNFLWLMLIHYLADYPLQGDYLAKGKNRYIEGNNDWFLCLLAHVMIHALLVYAYTGMFICFMIQAFAHFIIDDQKCAGTITYKQDQMLHAFVMFLLAGLYTFKVV